MKIQKFSGLAELKLAKIANIIEIIITMETE